MSRLTTQDVQRARARHGMNSSEYAADLIARARSNVAGVTEQVGSSPGVPVLAPSARHYLVEGHDTERAGSSEQCAVCGRDAYVRVETVPYCLIHGSRALSDVIFVSLLFRKLLDSGAVRVGSWELPGRSVRLSPPRDTADVTGGGVPPFGPELGPPPVPPSHASDDAGRVSPAPNNVASASGRSDPSATARGDAPSALWCNRCGLPTECPEHPDGVLVQYGPEDFDHGPCPCSVRLCRCVDPVYGPHEEESA